MSQDYEEKRSYFRMRIETEVNFTIKGESGSHTGISQDLSASGLLMYSAIAPEVGSVVDIEMKTSNASLQPFLAEGKVLRVEPDTPEPGQYLISVALTRTR